jgi:hypothetical protein
MWRCRHFVPVLHLRLVKQILKRWIVRFGVAGSPLCGREYDALNVHAHRRSPTACLGITQATFLFDGLGPAHLECDQLTNFKFSPLRGQERVLVVRDVTDGQLLHFAGEPFNPGLKGKKSLIRIDENLHKLTAYSSIWLSGFLWDMIRRIEAISSGVRITSWPVYGSVTVRQKLDRLFDPRFKVFVIHHFRK